jgi:hypothetical protein
MILNYTQPLIAAIIHTDGEKLQIKIIHNGAKLIHNGSQTIGALDK